MQKQVDYSDAMKTKYPEPVIILTAKDKKGKPNPMAVGWAMPASGSPPMLAVAIVPKRYTAQAINHSKCFTVTFPAENMADETLYFGTHSGHDIDKLKEVELKTQPASEIDSIIFSDAAANFECTLHDQFNVGDHIVFVGKVVAAHINTENKKRLYTIASGGKLGGIS